MYIVHDVCEVAGDYGSIGGSYFYLQHYIVNAYGAGSFNDVIVRQLLISSSS